MIRITILNIGGGVGFYTAFVYAVSYLRNIDKLSESITLEINTLAMVILLIILPFSGWLSDLYGNKKILLISTGVLVIFSIPVFQLIHSDHQLRIMIGEILFAIIIGMTSGGIVALNVKMIHPSARCTLLAFSYNAGRTTSLIAT